MSREEFFARLPETKRKFQWYLTANGMIRGERRAPHLSVTVVCPVTGLCEVVTGKRPYSVNTARIAALDMGLAETDSRPLIHAADKKGHCSKKLRKQLLTALGLQERSP